jgi:hypothetical protein
VLSNNAKAQSLSSEISFIKLTDDIGYIIDAAENDECKCISNYSKNEYNYAALIQLPDSSIVLRIMLVDSLGSRDIAMGKAEVSKLHSRASSITVKISEIDTLKEKAWIKTLAENTDNYKLIAYYMLQFPSLLDEDYETASIETAEIKNNFQYLNLGIGAGSFQGLGGISIGAEYGIINKNFLLSMHIFRIQEIQLFVSPNENMNDFALLFGRINEQEGFHISVSAGISYIYGVFRGNSIPSSGGFLSSNHAEKIIETIGLPLQIDLFVGATHNLGLNIIIFGNINQKCSFGGLLFCLQFGAIKEKK